MPRDEKIRYNHETEFPEIITVSSFTFFSEFSIYILHTTYYICNYVQGWANNIKEYLLQYCTSLLPLQFISPFCEKPEAKKTTIHHVILSIYVCISGTTNNSILLINTYTPEIYCLCKPIR